MFPVLPAEGITFTTQAQIDSFQVNYPGCKEIEGDVNISNSNITNLNGLNMLTSINGHLCIEENDELTDLTGLNNLSYIGGSTKIYRNDTLLSLAGLNDLDSIGGYLAISVNENLSSLNGLDNLITIGGYLSVSFNHNLASLMGLHNLTSIGYESGLYITKDDQLTDLKGLEGLTSVRHMYINDSSALTSLTGLGNLTTIEGVLSIGTFPPGNHSLKSLTGLESLIYIEDALEVGFNDSLASLTGLDNVEANTLSDLYIYWNSSLSNCAVQIICDYLAAPNGTVEIHDNATGCNSEAEVDSDRKFFPVSNFYFQLSDHPGRQEFCQFILSGNSAMIMQPVAAKFVEIKLRSHEQAVNFPDGIPGFFHRNICPETGRYGCNPI